MTRTLACGCVLGYERCIDCRPGLHPDQETACNMSKDRRYGEMTAIPIFLHVPEITALLNMIDHHLHRYNIDVAPSPEMAALTRAWKKLEQAKG
jgi:hypothetical protein